ncbi:MAG: hypothetical protein V2A58_16230 [Planctomycetota bacterium]
MSHRILAGLTFSTVAALLLWGSAFAAEESPNLVSNPSFEKPLSETDAGIGKLPVAWAKHTLSKEDKEDAAESLSSFAKVAGGLESDSAGALKLDAADKWVSAETVVVSAAPLAVGAKYVVSVAVKSAAGSAHVVLTASAVNPETKEGVTVEQGLDATPEWQTVSITLTINEKTAGLGKFSVAVRLSAPGEVLIDNVQVGIPVQAAAG